jgi:hypothetical protein
MLRVVALRPLPIPHQLGLGSRPGLRIDERRDPDRDPVSLGAPRATLAIAWVAIFKAARPIGPPDIPRLGAIIVGFAFIEGVTEQTASEPCLRQWGMKPTVLNRRNPADLNTLALTHQGAPAPCCAALGARRADISRARSS